MAVITYTQDSVLMAYQQWLMQQGATACLERLDRGQSGPDCAMSTDMVRAQPGSLLRYSVLTTLASATVAFMGQFVSDLGMWQNVGETVVGTSAGGIDQVVRPATAGCYKNMVATVGTAVVAGSEVYVLVELGRTNNGVFQPYAVLLSGYVRTNEPIDSGGGKQQQNPPTGTSGGGGCCLATLTDDVFDPDVGSYVAVVPSGANGRAIYVSTVYVASGVAANRYINLQLNPASGFGWTDTDQTPQTAGQAIGYTWQLSTTPYVDVSSGNHYRGLPDSLWFSGDFTVELRAVNPQVGDSWLPTDITYETKGP